MIRDRLTFTVGNHEIYLDTYLAEDKSAVREAILIIPGGGYTMVCHEREGGPIAEAFFERGLNAFVLHYAVGEDYKFPSHLIDASFAMVYLKKHACELGIDKDRIFTVGFSAGGHLSGCLAIKHDEPDVLAALGISKGDNKPCGSILAYPVVSAFCPTHGTSFEMLAGRPFDKLTQGQKERLSLEPNVNEDSAPVFIWHTSTDAIVPPLGSLYLAEAYLKLGLPVTFMMYPYGDHGIALANEITAEEGVDWVQPMAEKWVDSAIEWMKTIK